MSALWGKKDEISPERGIEGEQPMINPAKKETPAPYSGPAQVPVADSGGQINALLGKGSEFEGKLSFEGVVKIEGVMKGEITSKDKLVIGQGARVEAEINVGNAVVSGDVTGNITAINEVELLAPAKMRGNIKTPSLVIQKGVVFEGNCIMSGSGKAGKTSEGA
jgi:cytoskeletal protein CcmA (bactofilin family)